MKAVFVRLADLLSSSRLRAMHPEVVHYQGDYRSEGLRQVIMPRPRNIHPEKTHYKLQSPYCIVFPVLEVEASKELAAALVAPLSQHTFWSDSLNVLYWVCSHSRQLATDIGVKIGQIQSATSAQQWRHVPGKVNPADLPTRGLSASNLTTCKTWWEGPDFLQAPELSWPALPIVVPENHRAIADDSILDLPRSPVSDVCIKIANVTIPELSIAELEKAYGSGSPKHRVTATFKSYMLPRRREIIAPRQGLEALGSSTAYPPSDRQHNVSAHSPSSWQTGQSSCSPSNCPEISDID